MERLFSLLLDHPRDVCMTYIDHLWFSLGMAYTFALSAIKAVVHAFVPGWYITSTSDCVEEIHELLRESGCRDV